MVALLFHITAQRLLPTLLLTTATTRSGLLWLLGKASRSATRPTQPRIRLQMFGQYFLAPLYAIVAHRAGSRQFVVLRKGHYFAGRIFELRLSTAWERLFASFTSGFNVAID